MRIFQEEFSRHFLDIFWALFTGRVTLSSRSGSRRVESNARLDPTREKHELSTSDPTGPVRF